LNTARWHGEIRRAGAGDIDVVADLAAELAMSFEFSPERFHVSYPALLTADDACLLLAVTEGEVTGYLLGFRHLTFFANGPVGWVEEIVVRDRVRGQGAGRALMDAFEGWADAAGCALVALATRRAAPFYLSLGYEESAVYFRKVLPDHVRVPATAASPLAAPLQGRFSPVRFDPAHRLSASDADALLEAARWAPSAGNSQPWSFHLRRREEEGHGLLVEHLAPSSRRWAPDASALVVNLAHREFDDSGMPYSEFADYDLGQAVAHLTVQAHAMGLFCRQFRAFDLEGLEKKLGVAPGWRILTMTAIGVPFPDDGASPPARDRRSLTDLRTAGLSSDRA
jgi:nitroreductase/GNAT superfamily N-acetyltransferase